MDRPAGLQQITFSFPTTDVGAHLLFNALQTLVARVDGCTVSTDQIVLNPPYPHDAVPATAFCLTNVSSPTVDLVMPERVDFQVGALRLRSGEGADACMPAPSQSPAPPIAAGMSPAELALRFAGHVLCIDHTGVELPSSLVTRTQWNTLLDQIAAAGMLYEYPTGEEWFFILPSTAREFADEIRSFAAPRVPKFELTYGYVELPLIQIHFDTDLPRAEVEARLPAPKGFALPGVETFRSVYVAHPWHDLTIRCDFTFWSGDATGDWETGRWLVAEGRRLKSYVCKHS